MKVVLTRRDDGAWLCQFPADPKFNLQRFIEEYNIFKNYIEHVNAKEIVLETVKKQDGGGFRAYDPKTGVEGKGSTMREAMIQLGQVYQEKPSGK